MITQSRLQELLTYDPVTGLFYWKRAHAAVKVGDRAGCVNVRGYVMIQIGGRYYRGHRLAWLYVKGVWPPKLDHRDLNKSNNAWDNLRLASDSENQANRGRQRNNTSGCKGVSKHEGRWRADIHPRGGHKFLGCFDTLEEASAAYEAAAQTYFGEFARC